MKPVILLVDDEDTIRLFLEKTLRDEGYEALTAATGAEAIELTRSELPDLVLLDLKLPDTNGLDVLRQIKEEVPEVCVIMLTAFGDIETAVAAMKQQAFDFVSKPVNLEQLLLTIEKGLASRKLTRELFELRRRVRIDIGDDYIPGESAGMKGIYEIVKRVAESDTTTVLIQGESGTGKEMIATMVHRYSGRRDQPFLEINCASLPEELLESELFGHTRGAFTGASADKIGAFEEANGGTVLLDEISDASKPLQQKLRRVLQEGEIRPVGSAAFKKVDVRVIAATNKDLRREMEENRFLRDLYFRLNRFPIAVPPLRERPEDIPLLALHFLRQAPQRRAVPVAGISPDAMQYLVAQRWQDNNVRELRNVIELACDLASGDQIDRDALRRTTALLGSKADGQSGAAALCVPFEELVAIDERRFDALFAGDDAKPFRAIEREFMGKVIIATLKRCEWKLRRAARMLGLSPGKVREDLRDYLKAVMASDRDGAAPAAKLDMPAEILARKIADLGLGEE